jgi:hypothetical protein
MTIPSITCNSLTPPCYSQNDVSIAKEDICNVTRYALTKPQLPPKHNAFFAVLTCRLPLLPENNPGIAPATPNPGNPDLPSDSDKTQLKTAENSPISATPAPFLDNSQQTAFFARGRTNFNTKNTPIGHART